MNQVRKTVEEVAWENDVFRWQLQPTYRPKNTDYVISQGLLQDADKLDILDAVRRFEEFGELDEEHDLGRVWCPTLDGEGCFVVFYITYENVERTRAGDPYTEEVFRFMKIVNVEELGIPAYASELT